MHVDQTAHSGSICRAPELPFARYRLRFSLSGKMLLPAYTGSVWRGVFGHALKKIVCVTNLVSCPPCLLYRSCPYPYIFETPPPVAAKKMRKYTTTPHPFILKPPRTLAIDVYHIDLTLIGRGNLFLPYLIHAFRQAGERGLGKSRVPLVLMDVWQAEPLEADFWSPIYETGGLLKPIAPGVPNAPPAPPAVRLRFETPLRMQSNGHLVTPETFRFCHLFGTLLRRISMLTYFHTDTPLETDFAGLAEQARRVEL